ncbi:N-acetyltransferase B complex non catalytic subunit-domain-containing protein [Syncephalastrum racemosum]|uniref:N-acetyltransferase B complex non catalytic subunit-domain-containing protein n=1 Tax=Syncephalastrum racemosum TaxID=13706 RepID=A0A1X2HA39_SYNRA|nr:N-acetyltransferase B complex non catalytic subunit-domain-containing protein [Syncephalastrum racemosum]
MDYLTEKRLRPLYEAIDDGQNKSALQLANKLLKKNTEWPLVKALKAVVLVRTGKTEEATELCDQVKKTIPTDEPTLQAITMAYQELGQHQDVVSLYENAANQQPRNEEFGNNWFMAMVRSGDYKGQQAAALKLHRTFKQNKYLFWAIMSLALQENDLSYTLAERMMTKAQEEGRLEEVEHMRLFLLILLDQKKHSQALALLDESELGKTSLRDPEVRQIKVELLEQNTKWAEVRSATEQALRKENSDDWISWLAYFDAVEALMPEDKAVLDDARALVADLKKLALEATVLKRGPFLAELELDYRLSKKSTVDQSTLLEHLVSYFARFGSKSCCCEDIQTYVSFLRSDPEQAKNFTASLQDTIGDAKEKADKIRAVYKDVNVRKLERYLGLQSGLSKDASVALAMDLWQKYIDALPLGEGLEKTEYQYGDDYVLLASHVLLDTYLETKETSLLIQATSLLEMALVKSLYNFQIKLILVRLYAMLGVHARPIQIFHTMDIKQIQFDTMIHYFTDRYISLGSTDALEDLLSESLMIYKSNQVETPEMIVKAYQYGTFSKIQEFIEFRKRLEKSLQQAITNVELARIEAVRSSFQTKYGVQFFQELDVSKLKYDDAFIAEQSDNRDFKVLMNCNPEDSPKAIDLARPAQSTGKAWLQTFSYILNLLHAACSTKEGVDVTSLSEEFAAFLTRSEVTQHITAQELHLAKLIAQLANALALAKNNKEANASKAAENLAAAVELVEKLVPSSSFANHNVVWDTFHQVSIALEAYNYGSIFVEVIQRAVGLTSKDARRKASENAKHDIFLGRLFDAQKASKDLLLKIQTLTREGREFWKHQQQQKKLVTAICESDVALAYFKKDQSSLNDSAKKVVTSWNASLSQLSTEIDRRVLKMNQQ